MTATTPLPLLRAALAAARRGWPVFPLIPGGKRPALAGWPQKATVDADVLAVWWRSAPYNVGIACGPAGLLVIDLDGPRGRSSFTALAAAEPAPTFTVATPSGGEHRYYTVEPGTPAPSTVARLGERIDTRGAGGYVVAPGSLRRTVHGPRHYRIVDGRPAATVPDWITALLRPRTPVPTQRIHRSVHSAYGRAAVAGECALIRRASTGTRNAALFRAAVRLGTLVAAGVLDQQRVQDELQSASTVHCGIAGFTAVEARRAITNGLRYGKARPRPFRDC
jgi:hypothetical protein